MPKEETIEIRNVRSIIGEKNHLPTQRLTSSIVSKLKSLYIRSAGIVQLIHLLGTPEPNKVLGLSNSINAFYSDGQYLYAGLNTSPGKIAKVDLSTFTLVTTLTLGVGENTVLSLFGDGTYLYAGLSTTSAIIAKVRLSDFTEVSTLTLNAGENICKALYSDASYLYCGLNTGQVVKVDLLTFTRTSSVDPALGAIKCVSYDGTYLYVGIGSSPGKVVKIDIDLFSVDSTLTLEAGESDVRSMFYVGNSLYLLLGTSPAIACRIDPWTFTRAEVLSLGTGENTAASCFSDGTYLYIGVDKDNPGMVAKIDLASFTRSSGISISETGTDWARALYSDGIYLYIGTTGSQVIRKYLAPVPTLYDRTLSRISDLQHSGIYYVYPANAAPVTVTSGAGAYTKGNYAQVVPASTIKTVFYITGVILYDLTANTDYEVDIATGAAASESVIATVSHMTDNANLAHECIFPVPIKVAANTRIAARCSDGTGSLTCKVKVRYKT